MAEALLDLLAPELGVPSGAIHKDDPTTTEYLAYLPSISLESLSSQENVHLISSSEATVRSLKSLSAKSHTQIITSYESLASLSTSLPAVARQTGKLHSAIPQVENAAEKFSESVSKFNQSPVLDRRKAAMLLSRNVDRLSDILELPVLLSSSISASASSSASSSAITSSNYASALDLQAHVKRLQVLYPDSDIIASIGKQAEEAMRNLTTSLITSLRTQGVKLASGMRTIGWLRRVMPDLDKVGARSSEDHALGSLLLVCRLANLQTMLEALKPLQDLADQETEWRLGVLAQHETPKGFAAGWTGGQQTERYLKRYIEIYREQTFGVISMYNSIFPAGQKPESVVTKPATNTKQSTAPLPSPLSTFPMFMVDILTDTLRHYLPNVSDKAARESLLTQVLYCAGSLGRLGGDFSLILSTLEEEDDDPAESKTEKSQEEWVEVIKKHRVLAGRLEKLASGSSQKK